MKMMIRRPPAGGATRGGANSRDGDPRAPVSLDPTARAAPTVATAVAVDHGATLPPQLEAPASAQTEAKRSETKEPATSMPEPKLPVAAGGQPTADEIRAREQSRPSDGTS